MGAPGLAAWTLAAYCTMKEMLFTLLIFGASWEVWVSFILSLLELVGPLLLNSILNLRLALSFGFFLSSLKMRMQSSINAWVKGEPPSCVNFFFRSILRILSSTEKFSSERYQVPVSSSYIHWCWLLPDGAFPSSSCKNTKMSCSQIYGLSPELSS